MSLDERIFDILNRWTAARERGETLSAEQLCADCPELADEVRGRIKMLQAMEWLENSDGGSNPPAPVAQPRQPRPSTHDLANEPTIGFTPGAEQRPPEIGSYVRYVGDYELMAEIARGGMGVVFKARQVRLKRVVALKMILAGRLASDNEVRRFHTEAEAAANLEHPHIVPIFEVGEQKGLHYFSMGYVDGQSLAVRLADGPLPAREAATILRPVAEAVHYAHQKGVIHRDLKPGNILIDKQGQPRVTDFGLAKRVSPDASELTGTGQILGTASYMPPEQALGRPGLVRESADIYALGAVLYAMLTGRPPFQADNPVETLRQVMERDPVSPRQFNPAIPVDLETICLKCLEKVASRRYATAQELADELGRFLEGKPLLARPVSALNRAWRWCQRNRTVASLLTAVAASLVIGIAVSSYFAIREMIAHGKAQESARQANRQAANLALKEADNLCKQGEANVGLLWMARAHELATAADDADLADASRATISGWLSTIPRLETSLCEVVNSVGRFGADDQTVVIARKAEDDARLSIHDATSGNEESSYAGPRIHSYKLAISRDRTQLLLSDGKDYRVWSLTRNAWQTPALQITGELSSADFSLDGKLLAIATDEGLIRIWKTPTGEMVNEFLEPQAKYSPRVCQIRFDRTGTSLWIAGTGNTLARRRVADGEPMQSPLALGYPVFSITYDPRRNQIAVGEMNHGIQLVDVNPNPPKQLASATSQLEYELSFHPSGKYLLAGGRGLANEARLWELPSLKPASAALSVPATTVGVQFSNDGHRMLVSHLHGVELWRTPHMATLTSSTPLKAPFGLSHFSLSRRQLVGVDTADEKRLVAWSIPSGNVALTVGPFEHPIRCLSADPLARVAVFVDDQKRLLVVDLRAKTWRGSTSLAGAIPNRIQVSPNGAFAFLEMPDRTVEVWNLSQPSPMTIESYNPQASVGGAAFDNEGNRLAICDQTNAIVHVVDFTAPERVTALPVGQPAATMPAFHPDGRRLYFGRYGGNVEAWSLADSKRLQILGQHDSSIYAIKISPSGEFAVTSGTDQTVRVWNLQRDSLQGVPIRNIGRIYDTIEISPDSRLAAIHSQQLQCQVIHLRTGRLVTPQIEIEAHHVAMHFAPDASQLECAAYEGSRMRSHTMPNVPQTSDALQLFVTAWTGMALDGDDVRVLPRDEWRKRKDRLVASGWKDTEFPPLERGQDDPTKFPRLPTPTTIATDLSEPLEIVYSADGRRVAVCSRQATKVWDVQSRSLVRDLGPQSGARAICLTREGDQVLTGDGYGLKWWNVASGELVRTVRLGRTVTDIALSPDEEIVAVGLDRGGEAKVLDSQTGAEIQVLKLPESPPSELDIFGHGKVAFSPDGTVLVTAWGGRGGPAYTGVDSTLSIWELPTWRLRASGVADESRLRNLQVTTDGKWIAAPCHARGRVKLWPLSSSPENGKSEAQALASPRTISFPRGQWSSALTPDNRFLAICRAGELDSAVSLANLDTLEVTHLPILQDVIDMAFRPGSRQLGALNPDGTLALWDLESVLQEPQSLNLNSPGASAVTVELLLQAGKELTETQFGKLRALPVLQRALALQQAVVAASPGDPEAQAQLGMIYRYMALDRYQAPRDTPERNGYLDDFQRSADALEIVVAHSQATPQHAKQLLNPLGSLGLLKNDVNLLKQTLDRARTLTERFGDHADLKYSRARLMHYISHLTRASDPAESLRLNDEAAVLFDELYSLDKRPEAAHFLGLCVGIQVGNVAKIPPVDPRRQRDKASVPRAIEVMEEVSRDYPQRGNYGSALVLLLHNAACLDYYEGKLTEAAPQFERAAKLAQALIDQGHTGVPNIWKQMRYAHSDAAYCFARAEDDRAAWEKAVQLAEHVITGTPRENREFGYADLYNALAVAKFRLGDAEAARTAIDKAIEIRKSRRSNDLFWRSVILEKLGEKDQATADWKEAEAWLAANPADDPFVLAIDKPLAEKYRTASP